MKETCIIFFCTSFIIVCQGYKACHSINSTLGPWRTGKRKQNLKSTDTNIHVYPPTANTYAVDKNDL